MNYTTIIDQLQKKLPFLAICCRNIFKKIADKYEIKVGDVKKLIPNFSNNANYVVNYRNLQLYLSLRMNMTKIHRVLEFKQSDWVKKYIDFNNGKGMNANNDFEKYFFKLMINFVYGKNNGKFTKKNQCEIGK